MSNGYHPGVREVRPGEDPPTCWDCLACGIGEECFCTSPTHPAFAERGVLPVRDDEAGPANV